MKKLDCQTISTDNPPSMHKVVHSENIKAALAQKGWTQKQLAESLGVSAQAVTLWLKGEGLPRPDKLLKLATTLRLSLGQLVKAEDPDRPVVAFRKRAATKTTQQHVDDAVTRGKLLRALVPSLPELRALRTELPNPSTDYADLQRAVAQTRAKLGIGQDARLAYSVLISEFAANDAFLVPVLWGEKSRHENALHILLPATRVTFIYLNIDARIEDFKFWMAHELAHVYTPPLAGSDEGEDFADAFAGALLFPQALAERAWREANSARRKADVVAALMRHATAHEISLFTVYCQAQAFAKAHGLRPLALNEGADIHAVRSAVRGRTVAQDLFGTAPPDPGAYLAAAQNVFRSEFFPSLQRMLKAHDIGPAYLQQILDLPLADATALHAVLTR
ncbi:helix-turn-helix domain-containing protein [Mitsuaria sp. GD03876]|uniref:helix-turn-helix domain-containing protein n=1 Tax=Mitsuaria sp. GD03876 TaxID=2975399 RepID=UPI002448C5FA|nr:helix-turn-helix domain-containing protein [Mitsuaria sp. GD03876]MDH0863033.1 helix-turn-helix domain-containing protein [Mitsuaria sp. GD03876]